MKYKIFDINKGLMSKDIYVEANSPKEALRKVGYVDICRDYLGHGNIVVSNRKGSYVYYANRKEV